MRSACFPVLYDHTNNQEKFQVPKIILNTAPRFSFVTIIDDKVRRPEVSEGGPQERQ